MALPCCLFLAGCSPPTGAQLPPEEAHLRNLAVFYGQYTNQHRGQTPPGEKEFKQFIKGINKETLESFKIDPNAIDDIFISPRDSAPYVIAYKSKASSIPDAQGKTTPIIWEKTGVGGKRYVGDGLGKVELITDEEFKKRVPNAG